MEQSFFSKTNVSGKDLWKTHCNLLCFSRGMLTCFRNDFQKSKSNSIENALLRLHFGQICIVSFHRLHDDTAHGGRVRGRVQCVQDVASGRLRTVSRALQRGVLQHRRRLQPGHGYLPLQGARRVSFLSQRRGQHHWRKIQLQVQVAATLTRNLAVSFCFARTKPFSHCKKPQFSL